MRERESKNEEHIRNRGSNNSSSSNARRVTFDLALKELKRHHFGVLSTVTKDGRSHSVEVVYGVSQFEQRLTIYVMTSTHLKKARNIMTNPNVSFAVPLTRRALTFLPPPSIQFQGMAEIIDWKNEFGVQSFKAFFMGRRILGMYDESYRQGERRICFLRITPDQVLHTYMLGHSIWEMWRRMEGGIEKIQIPQEFRKQHETAAKEV